MAKSLELQIDEQQRIAWGMAEQCATIRMQFKDRIYERGCISVEVECRKKIHESESDSERWKKRYLVILFEMKRFYSSILNAQMGSN